MPDITAGFFLLPKWKKKTKNLARDSVHSPTHATRLNNNCKLFDPLSAKLTKWPNTLKQFLGNLPTNCLSVFGHFMGLALKGLMDMLILTA